MAHKSGPKKKERKKRVLVIKEKRFFPSLPQTSPPYSKLSAAKSHPTHSTVLLSERRGESWVSKLIISLPPSPLLKEERTLSACVTHLSFLCATVLYYHTTHYTQWCFFQGQKFWGELGYVRTVGTRRKLMKMQIAFLLLCSPAQLPPLSSPIFSPKASFYSILEGCDGIFAHI